MVSASTYQNLRAKVGDMKKPFKITLAVHLFGRELFSLSFEWISKNPVEGTEPATPLPRGLLCITGIEMNKRILGFA